MAYRKILNVTAIKMLGSIIAFAVNFALASVLAVHEYVEYLIKVSLVVFASSLIAGGWQKYIVRRYHENNSKVENFSIIIFSLLSMVALYSPLHLYLGSENYHDSTHLVMLSICVSVLIKLISANLRVQNHRITGVGFEFLLPQLILASALVINSQTFKTYCLSLILSLVLMMSYLAINKIKIKATLSSTLDSYIVKDSLVLHLIVLSNLVFGTFDLIILSAIYEDEIVASYKLALQIAFIPDIIISSAVLYFQPDFSRFASNKDYKNLQILATRLSRKVLILALPVFLTILISSQFAIEMIYSDKYPTLQKILIPLLVGVMSSVAVGCTGVILNMLKLERYILFLNIAISLLYLLSMIAIYFLKLDALSISVMAMLCYLVKSTLSYYFVYKKTGIKIYA